MARDERSTTSKLLWFIGLWLAGVAVISLVGLIIKTVL